MSALQEEELWKAIPGFEGKYEASNQGRIRSLDRISIRPDRWGNMTKYRLKGRILGLDPHHTGYLVVKLGRADKQYRVHQLVAITWIGPTPEGMVVSHSDDNKWNNAVRNLEYMTNPENVKRAYRTGRLSNCGETNGKAVLTDDLVRKILEFPRTVSARKVAMELGLKKHNVDSVRQGRGWKHIPREVAA